MAWRVALLRAALTLVAGVVVAGVEREGRGSSVET